MQDIIGNLFDFGNQGNDGGSVYQDADLRYWAKMPCWNYLELTCVTLGFEPGPILAAHAEQLESDDVKLALISKRSKLAHRAVEVGDLPACITPKRAIEWLGSIGEEVPEGLEEALCELPIYSEGPLEYVSSGDLTAVVAAIGKLADIVQGREESPANPSAQSKEIASLQKIVLTMAVKGYGYEPSLRRTAVYGEIADDSVSIGLNLHVDTVRKHLRLAVDNHWCEHED